MLFFTVTSSPCIEIINGITNPSATGDYRLEVKTTEEPTYVESAPYTMKAPVVGGFVYVYNPSNVLMATYGGKDALDNAKQYYDDDDFTITVGPGSYVLGVTKTITIAGEGLTLESSEGAATTIIDATGAPGIMITADDVTLDGFTIEGDTPSPISIQGDDVTVKNNIITSETLIRGITTEGGATGAIISGNILQECILYVGSNSSDSTVSDNTVTDACINVGCGGNSITGNIISGDSGGAIEFMASLTTVDNLIEGNTLFDNGAGIKVCLGAIASKLVITENDIIDNDIGILIESAAWDVSNVIKFNTITGSDDYGIKTTTNVSVDATFNWWGTTVAADIADMIKEATDSDIDYDPFLTDTAEATILGGKAAANAASLDAKTACGVKVSGMDDGGATTYVADVICALKYAANPEGAISDAIAFYDIYVVLDTIASEGIPEDVSGTLKFYDTAITSASTAYFWTGDFWALCLEQDARAGLIWVTVDEDTAPSLDELDGTPFVVVAGEAVEAFGAPLLLAPDTGADDVSLTPTFAWSGVTGADGYYFEFADNANFVVPLVKRDGDLGRLIVTAYAYVTELPYSTAYYWRVKAVSGTVAAGDLLQSAWTSGVFITMDEPEEPTPPVVVEETPAPIIVIEETPAPIIQIEPIVEVVTPPATPITPAWIYVIIGVGGVLVIALLVLIVRTRRVA